MRGTGLDRRLRAIEKTQERNTDNLHVYYEFLTRPTCPPGKTLIILPGMISSTTSAYIPQQVADLTDVDNMVQTWAFTNAYWYIGVILCFDSAWVQYHGNPDYFGRFYTNQYDNVVCEEMETAAEAEACIDALMNGADAWFSQRFPLCGLVLRNTGVVGVDGEVLPIDAVNRGRSYLYRDLRARTMFCD